MEGPRRARSRRVSPKTLAIGCSVCVHVLSLLSLIRTPPGDNLPMSSAQEATAVELSLVEPSHLDASPPSASIAPRPWIAAADAPPPPEIFVAETAPPGAPRGEAAQSREAVEATGAARAGATEAHHPGQQDASREYRRQLLAHIRLYRRYPDAPSPERNGGAVQLLFGLSRDGAVTDVRIVRTSGVSALDEAAVATVLRAQPLPPIPAPLPDRLTVQLPVSFMPA